MSDFVISLATALRMRNFKKLRSKWTPGFGDSVSGAALALPKSAGVRFHVWRDGGGGAPVGRGAVPSATRLQRAVHQLSRVHMELEGRGGAGVECVSERLK